PRGSGPLAIGAPLSGDPGRGVAGSAYVLFGVHPRGGISLAAMRNGTSRAGWWIEGAYTGDRAGYSVAPAGDVNGDGIPDVLVGAPRVDTGGALLNVGAVYVVFGRTRPGRVDLAQIGGPGPPTLGYRIISVGGGPAGQVVAPAGDVNGDGIPD